MYIYAKRRRRPAHPAVRPQAAALPVARPAIILDLATWRDRLAAANAPERQAA